MALLERSHPLPRTFTSGTTTRLVSLALTLALVLGGLAVLAGPASAHPALAPQHAGDHGTDDGGFFNLVEGFSTKTGYRLVFAWDADQPIAGFVEWGFSPDQLDRTARPVADAVDTAGIAIVDVGEAETDGDATVYFRVRDAAGGQVSDVHAFTMGNAWTTDGSDGLHEVDLLVQLDTQALPDSAPVDQGLKEISRAVDIFAERIWDASDEHVRIDDVIVTDTLLNYPANPSKSHAELVGLPDPQRVCPGDQGEGEVAGTEAGHTFADVLITTTVPFDSHTQSPRIDHPCTAIYMGRLGQLVTTWGSLGGGNGSVHMGQVLAHEFGHYGFGLTDLYPGNPTANGDCWAGVSEPPNNEDDQWDVTMMHNQFGWTGSRWVGTEIDRGPDITPCGYNGDPANWPIFADLWPGVPTIEELQEQGETGEPYHGDSQYDQLLDNPDGGALDVYYLDHEVGASQLQHMIRSNEESTGDTAPGVTIHQPADGSEVIAGQTLVEGLVDRDAPVETTPSATLSADPATGEPPHTTTFTLDGEDPDEAIVSWTLDPGFDQATYEGTELPATVEHTYQANGTYEATLTVTDTDGQTATAVAEVHVGPTGTMTRIGTDPAGDTNTGDCNDPTTACSYDWLDPARAGMDLRAAWVEEVGDEIRFTFQVDDAAAFFEDPEGDDDAITQVGLSARFSTTPATAYRMTINRTTDTGDLDATLTREVGVLLSNTELSVDPVVDNATDRFQVDLPKSQVPELVATSSIEDLDAVTTFTLGSTVYQLDTGLATIEASSYGFLANAPVDALSSGLAMDPAPAPSQIPAEVEITDPAGDVTAANAPVSHMDLRHAWFDNDDEHLYVGLHVEDIPTDPATTTQISYKVPFNPQFNRDHFQQQTPAGTFSNLRVTALLDASTGDITTGEHTFELQLLYEDPNTGSSFLTLQELPRSTIDPDSDIIWWVVPQSALADPQDGDTLTDLSADSNADFVVLSVSGGGLGDAATTSATFSFSEGTATDPVFVDPQGPYAASVGSPVTLTASASGGDGDYSFQWDLDDDGTFDATGASVEATFDTAGEHTVTVNATDGTSDGADSWDERSTTVTVEPAGEERVDLFVDDEAEPRASLTVDTDDQTPSDAFDAVLDLSLLINTPGEHTLTAVWYEGDAELATTTTTITIPRAKVNVNQPADGATVIPATELAGNVSTTGILPPAEPTGGDAGDQMTQELETWLTDADVQRLIRSDALAELTDTLGSTEGFIAALPNVDGEIVALYEAGLPDDVPATAGEADVVYLTHVEMHELATPLDGPPAPETVRSVAEIAAETTGPKAPTPLHGIGPGSPIQSTFGTTTSGCTASYLFQAPGTSQYYLSTAGHCLLDGATTSEGNPDALPDTIYLCIQDCVTNQPGLRPAPMQFVEIQPGDVDGEMVPFARADGVGEDFGLIKLPQELNEHLRPWMWFWGGPTGMITERPLNGDPLVHWGYGLGVGATPPEQGRVSVNVRHPNPDVVQAVGLSMPGDSGSSVGVGAARTSELLLGGDAAGVLTHGPCDPLACAVPLTGVFTGTMLEHGIREMAAADTSPTDLTSLALVTEDAEILPGDTDPPATEASVTIDAPTDGATLDQARTPTVEVAGTAEVPDEALPGEGNVTYYLQRDGCGSGDDRLFMNRSASQQETTCGNLAQPVGPVYEALGLSLAETFPADPAPGQAIWLDPNGQVNATIVLSGYQGAEDNPQPVPSIVNDLEVRLTADGTEIGSQRITDELVVGNHTPVSFSFDPDTHRIPAGAELAMTFVVHHSVGPVFVHYGGPTPSHVDLPRGTSAAELQISVDDGTFSPGSLLTVATHGDPATWTADWPISDLSLGPHTLTARVLHDGQPVGTTDTVTVDVTRGAPVIDVTPVVDDETVTFELDVESTGPTTIAWDFGDGATSTEEDPTHTYADSGRYRVSVNVSDDNGYTREVLDVGVGLFDLQLTLTGPSGEALIDGDAIASIQQGEHGTWSTPWAPSAAPAGTYTLTSRLVDHGATLATGQSTFDVPDVAPTITAPDTVETLEGHDLALAVTASDVNGDALTLSAEELPAGAELVDHGDGTGTLAWTPRFDQAGTHEVNLTASDGTQTTTTTTTITVTDAAAATDGTGYATIQAAIDAAAPGQTVLVDDGRHVEALTVDTNATGAVLEGLTLCSADAAMTTCTSDAEATTVDANGTAETALTVAAPDVTVQALTIQNSNTTSTATGVALAADGAQLVDSRVIGNLEPTGHTSSETIDQIGVTIAGAAPEDVRVEASTIEAWRNIGIYVAGSAGDGAEIRGNDVTGNRHHGVLLEGPSGAADAGTLTVAGNTIAEHGYSAIRLGIEDTRAVSIRENVLDATNRYAVTVQDRVEDARLDVRLNDWQVTEPALIRERIDDAGTGNTVLTTPFLLADGTPEPGLPTAAPASHSTDPATCDAHPDAEWTGAECRFLTVQAAIDHAHAGANVVVPASQDTVDPTPYPGAISVDENTEGEPLANVTVCGSVVAMECAPVDEPARWGIYSEATWGTPPVAHQGQALRMDAGATGSTSLFTRDAVTGEGAPQVEDLTGLGFDMLLESGDCPAGAPRVQLSVDTDQSGEADTHYQVHPDTSFECPAPGDWVHVDLLDGDGWGGQPGTDQAGAQAELGPDHAIVSMNLIWDGGDADDVAWFDNQRYQDSFLREPSDACSSQDDTGCRGDPEIRADEQAILDADATAATTATLAADGATLADIGVQNTGKTGEATGVLLGADGVRLTGSRVVGNQPNGSLDVWGEQEGVEVSGADRFEIADTTIRGWDNMGLMVAGSSTGDGAITDNTIELNTNHGLYISGDAPDATLTVRGNTFGLHDETAIRLDAGERELVVRANDLSGGRNESLLVSDRWTAETIDMRGNHWGAVGETAIRETRVNDQGDHTVLVTPYLDAAGHAHPPLPEIHCMVDGQLTQVDTAIALQAAVDQALPSECTAAHRTVVLGEDAEAYTGATIATPVTLLSGNSTLAHHQTAGVAAGGATVEATEDGPALAFLPGSEASHVNGLTVQASTAQPAIRASGLADGATALTLENVHVQGDASAPASGIVAEDGAAPRVVSSLVTEADPAVSFTNTTGGSLEDGGVKQRFSATEATHGIVLDDARDATVTGTTIHGNLYPGSTAVRAEASQGLAVVDNLLENAGTAVYLADSHEATVEDNVILMPPTSQFTSDSLAVSLDGGTDHSLARNLVSGAGVGLNVAGAEHVTSEQDAFHGVGTGVRVSSLTGAGTAAPDLAVRNASLAAATSPLVLDGSTEALAVDATCNDWGVYHASLIETRISDAGEGNDVTVQPWTSAEPTDGETDCLVPPEASFEATPETASRVDTVTFESTSEEGSRPIVDRRWDFGDGETASTGPEDDASTVEHAYGVTGSFNATLTVEDTDGMVSRAVQRIVVENEAPTIDDIGDRTLHHTGEVGFRVTADDPEDDPITLEADGLPGGAYLHGRGDGAADVYWDPDPSQFGTYTVKITADDGQPENSTDTEFFKLHVTNEAPVFDEAPPASLAGAVNRTLTLDVSAHEIDQDTLENLTADLSELGPGATFETGDDPTTGTLTWTPEPGSEGNHEVSFHASGPGRTTTRTTTLSIGDENLPPAITFDQVTRERPEGATVAITATASDPDGPQDPVDWSIEPTAIGDGIHPPIIFDEVDVAGDTATWTWEIPDTFDADVLVTFSADDGLGATSANATVLVQQRPDVDTRLPQETRTGISTRQPITGEPVVLSLAAADADGNVTDVTVFPHGPDAPSETMEVAGTGFPGGERYEHTVTYDAAGSHPLVYRVTDDEGLVTWRNETIHPVDNTAPEVSATPSLFEGETDGPEGMEVDLRGSASDPENRMLADEDFEWVLDGEVIATGKRATGTVPVGVHTVELEVTDPYGATGTAPVTVRVDDRIHVGAHLTGDAELIGPSTYRLDPVATAGENITGWIDVADDILRGVDGASVEVQALYYGTQGNEEGALAEDAAELVTGANGSVKLDLTHTLGGAIGQDASLLSAPGYHELHISASADSRPEGAEQDTETDATTIAYWVGPQGTRPGMLPTGPSDPLTR